MALHTENPEHLKILKQGVGTWNNWRMENRYIEPNLSGVDLSYADFISVDFSFANLSGAKLIGAKLRHANLVRADLTAANLEGADLSHAHLGSAIFFNTYLSGADFTNANMGLTLFGHSDLSQVNGLGTIHPFASSAIDIATFYRSAGKIPETFLRGCGVPEDFITYMRSLTAKAIEFYSCFISYSSKDEEFAKRLYNDLQSEGVRCWFAPEDLKIGEKFRVRIDESIRLYDRLLLVLSENSVASEWVEKEVETAFEKEREQKKTVLFPVQLDDAVLEAKTGWAADVRRSRHIGEFREWKNHDSYRKAFERLMRDLKAEAGR